jgi:hypothetical protein
MTGTRRAGLARIAHPGTIDLSAVLGSGTSNLPLLRGQDACVTAPPPRS